MYWMQGTVYPESEVHPQATGGFFAPQVNGIASNLMVINSTSYVVKMKYIDFILAGY